MEHKILPTCKLCGAVGHGNITCPKCRSKWDWLTNEEHKAKFKGTPIFLPMGLQIDSIYMARINKVNKANGHSEYINV